MPASFSNIQNQQSPGNAASRASKIAGTFDRPKKLANPFSLTAAIKSKTADPALKPPAIASATATTGSSSQRTPNNTGTNQTGLTESQVRSNLDSYYNAQPRTPQVPPEQRLPSQKQTVQSSRVIGNTQPSANVVGMTFPEERPKMEETPSETLKKTGLYGQLVGRGVENLEKAAKVQDEAGLLRQAMQKRTRDVYGNPYYSGSVKTGLAANISQQQGAQLEGLAAQERALTAGGEAYLRGATAAAPIQLPYGTQYVSPVTGQSAIPGGVMGGEQNPQNQASVYADEVTSGRRSYSDAISAMALYGNAGKQFLDQAIRRANPNFNFAQAQTLGGQQGMVGPNYTYAVQALDAVDSALQSVGGLQQTNIPILNQFANIFSLQTGRGGEETRKLVGALQTLRNAYAALLASARGGTPTDYSSQAQAEIPDTVTPNDLAAIRRNLETLGAARVQIFGAPGSAQSGVATGATTGTGNDLFKW